MQCDQMSLVESQFRALAALAHPPPFQQESMPQWKRGLSGGAKIFEINFQTEESAEARLLDTCRTGSTRNLPVHL